MEDIKKKRIFRTLIVVLIGAFILWLISLLFARNRIKEDANEIMKFLNESEERTQQKF
jgi:hypothetical protein